MNARTRHRAGRPGTAADTPPPRTDPDRLGGFTAGQLDRLCEVVGIGARQRVAPQRVLSELLGPAAARPLADPPPSPSFVSDDHTPVEFSLTFPSGAAPVLRVLADPGCAARTLPDNARLAWAAVARLAAQWGVGLGELTRVSDLFLPPVPQGPLTLWCALELRPGGPPGLKLYLNPGARGAERSMDTVGEAMDRLGHAHAFEPLRRCLEPRFPERAGLMFFALDVGPWAAPRAKVYVVHRHATAADAADAARLVPGACPRRVADLCHRIGGEEPFAGLPLISGYSFTGARGGGGGGGGGSTGGGVAAGPAHPTGHTLYLPVRDLVRDDREARDHAVALLRQYGVADAPLDRALAALTPRPLSAGRGLISYLGLVQAGGRPPRITVYLSSEAYGVLPPRDDTGPTNPVPGHRAPTT
ncbi:tryptophan dimethylallyltransferase family protein [Streptomyces griseiscabiei]|uniref:Tryptophan dimethylallyltransferase family protein n=1 Tax=Streptomyces griseiscabiei TaxID=2993540 RepID=A0ABU4L1P0_9ACTN|nr:tryptophan dimethylallyltransferase family protein [Streptomyces griseiscabiei]MBZ3906020.1 prenyltransferase [Streptomyces griseiscabiei]MDX2909652.1 tryptophan dimethylallyltransferase family protein [Streptomyces griseiscabiei]